MPSGRDCAALLAITTANGTPAQFTADKNDLDLGLVHVARVTTDATRTLTGIANGVEAADSTAGRHYWLVNADANGLVLANESANSAASNRMWTGTGANVTIAASKVAHLYYDTTSARWRLLSNT